MLKIKKSVREMRNDFSGLISRLTQRGEESLRLRYLNRKLQNWKTKRAKTDQKKKNLEQNSILKMINHMQNGNTKRRRTEKET